MKNYLIIKISAKHEPGLDSKQKGGGKRMGAFSDTNSAELKLFRKNGELKLTKEAIASGATVIHHHPPKDSMKDVGRPFGQTLLIAYFPWEATEKDIRGEFEKLGSESNVDLEVKRVHLVLDKDRARPRCFGFVKFGSPGQAKLALEAAQNGIVIV